MVFSNMKEERHPSNYKVIEGSLVGAIKARVTETESFVYKSLFNCREALLDSYFYLTEIPRPGELRFRGFTLIVSESKIRREHQKNLSNYLIEHMGITNFSLKGGSFTCHQWVKPEDVSLLILIIRNFLYLFESEVTPEILEQAVIDKPFISNVLDKVLTAYYIRNRGSNDNEGILNYRNLPYRGPADFVELNAGNFFEDLTKYIKRRIEEMELKPEVVSTYFRKYNIKS